MNRINIKGSIKGIKGNNSNTGFGYSNRLNDYMESKLAIPILPLGIDHTSRVITAKHNYRCDSCSQVIGKYSKFMEVKQYRRDKNKVLTKHFYILRKHRNC